KVSPVFILGKIIQLALLFYLVEAALFQVLFILVALFILREVYCLRKLVLLDNFDLIRVKPLSSWLRILIICQYLGLTNYW
ncbi:MAG: hypothetical protein ABSA43_02025, partial [Candidatus Microgenomates bacterium]